MIERYRAWASYFIAVLSVAVALEVRYLLIDNISEDTIFLAAVAVAAIAGGLLPGLLATGLSVVLTLGDFSILYHDSQHPWWTLAFFAVESLVISGICGMLHKSRRRANAHAQEAAALRDRIISISEAEQRRIGQDLHDGLGQQLTGIAFLCQSLARRLGKRQAPEAEEVGRIVNMVSQTIGWTRDLARGLTPVAMEADDLVSALRHLADSASSMFRIHCECVVDERTPVIAPDAAIHLYRIAQEAVNNAVKHANATEVRIELHGGECTELCVRDDGRGFDATCVKPGGLGLEIMGHRARLIGACLTVRNADDGGTLVCCRMGQATQTKHS